MARSVRPRLIRTTAAAFAIAAASVTTAACGDDVVDDGVEQNVEEGITDLEEEVDDATDNEG
ncbi:hypothetical protein [Blastococcus xanthinilyticus]|uniref:Uncharacterized protein n=1 Tax=Blastococcus xanthinilyticus TaxID=1564164 RepID=A0A5S5CX37_9ACTN|nr:hypothetical protein [Blastococcus xanthinilyticus]TYP88337.1 hypothetical protein BD833_10440 [Blastococcus xanthinilyticus]